MIPSVIPWLIALGLGAALGAFYFSTLRPLKTFYRGIERFRRGDFGARILITRRGPLRTLATSFNEMAERMEIMVRDLHKLDEMKTDFISTVSHELRTPLTSIGGYVKLLLSGDAGPITENQKEFLFIVDTNVVRLTHLINDLLDVEKMESGHVQLIEEPQDLVSILKECRDTFGITASQKGLELRYKVPDRMSTLLGDRGRLIQIFMNLISNAIKYTEKGYVSIEAEEREYAVLVRIRDTGVGLNELERTKLFQKFYRARSGLASGEGGTGLGLAIVQGLVDAHRGTIAVESSIGSGTVFTVSLPIEKNVTVGDQSIVQIESARDEDAVAKHEWSRPVWILDRQSDDVKRMAALFESAGNQFGGYALSAKSFGSVGELPEVTHADEAPAMVIVDPANFGLESEVPDAIFTALRRKLHRTVPILVVSATVDAAGAFAEGASALLTKPIGEREFLIAVKDLTSTKGLRVLVADHNTDLRILLKRGLEQRGYVVDDVDRGAHVLSRLEQEAYDLTLIDLAFPDVPGLELLKVIRKKPRFKDLPVFVMLDGDKNLPSQEDLASWGANQFVGKYRGIGGIIDAVCQYLEEKRT